jgi:hypothetical protein
MVSKYCKQHIVYNVYTPSMHRRQGWKSDRKMYIYCQVRCRGVSAYEFEAPGAEPDVVVYAAIQFKQHERNRYYLEWAVLVMGMTKIRFVQAADLQITTIMPLDRCVRITRFVIFTQYLFLHRWRVSPFNHALSFPFTCSGLQMYHYSYIECQIVVPLHVNELHRLCIVPLSIIQWYYNGEGRLSRRCSN